MADAASTGSTIRLRVGMTCGGCEGAVTRILGKLEGVTDVTTSVADKLVTCKVAPPATAEAVVAALQKWGSASKKEVTLLA
ncbi:hypothetical protein FNF27_07397 [Cafeteria roenbergensis]|uniref:HMA domain-containing protein n=1 Tax=Cafeteria roenbergensis TaxID=33653 RepID=A0A5A8DH22_CAFRO|nr:hypothetical protein FNF29_07811 [Cafeteria roenbergensis]KAA0164359.1 hypothetical protein FNF28_03899 [Cafeteria roenbergensis]KAA0167069.1 hypothetical protein FNF27_07397 [Cafeteria roenbergensis]|mmetsp:Transcript_16089/g.60894  ORF Transcript_16089/g.60894 Transcript_16089/m.60894 type:complete len:81 (+) Transcript_16089:29-271(+)|eukprot:KAA0146835.1 hypothetical protein FNF29_07811 [Cafeteria roenbergensis]